MNQRATERDLVIQFKEADDKVEELKAQLKAASEELDKAEAALIELMEANGAEATAKYDSIGYVKLMKPRLYAHCKQENFDKLIDYLAKKNREDLIKTTVMPQSLSSFVSELIECGEAIPKFIGYYMKQSIRLYS